MDPLSITAGAVGLAAHALRAAVFVRNTLNEMQDAPAFTRDIAEDIIVVQGSLNEIERALSRNPLAIRNFGLNEMFDVSVGGCHDVLERIGVEFDGLFGRDDWRGRLAVWWNTSAIHRLLESLGAKKASLTLLVQALSLRSMQEIHELMERNQATLDLAGLGLEGLRHSYGGYTAGDLSMVASEIGSVDGIIGDRDSVLSDSGFGFDSVCILSKAYRRTVARTLNEKETRPCDESHLPDIKEDEETVEDEDKSESSEATPVPATAPQFVEIRVHEAVCARLRDAEARILVLEALLRERGWGRGGEAGAPPVGNQDSGGGSEDARGLPVPRPRTSNGPRPMAADGGRLRGAAARPGDEPSVRPKSAWLPKISRWSETTTSQIPSQSTSPAVPRQPEKESAAPTEREGPSHPSVGTTKPTDCAAKEPGGVGNSPKRGGQPEPKEPGGEKAQDPRNKGKPEPGDHLVGNPNAPAEPQARSSAPASKTAKSQTELLIEYFEGSKPVGTANARKPSVRVRVTPSSKAGKSRRNVDTIAIPRPHSTSKGPKRKPPRPVAVEDREEGMGADLPLPSDVSSIPACSFLDKPDRADGKAAPSNISAIPADSFLDGPGADRSSSSRMKTDRRSQGKAARRISKASKLDDEKPRRKSSRGHTEAVVSEAPLTEAQQKLLEDIRRIILPPMKKKQETEQQPASQKQANQRSGTNDPAQLAPDVDDSMSLPDDLTTETGSRRRRRAGGWQRKGQVFGALEPVLEENKSIPPPSLPTLSEVLAMPLGSTTCATISSRGCEPLNVPVAPSSKKKEDLNASKTSGPGKTPLPPLSDAAVRLLHLVDEQEAASDRSRAMLVGLCRSLQDQFDGKIQRLEQGVVGEASAEMKEMKV